MKSSKIALMIIVCIIIVSLSAGSLTFNNFKELKHAKRMTINTTIYQTKTTKILLT